MPLAAFSEQMPLNAVQSHFHTSSPYPAPQQPLCKRLHFPQSAQRRSLCFPRLPSVVVPGENGRKLQRCLLKLPSGEGTRKPPHRSYRFLMANRRSLAVLLFFWDSIKNLIFSLIKY